MGILIEDDSKSVPMLSFVDISSHANLIQHCSSDSMNVNGVGFGYRQLKKLVLNDGVVNPFKIFRVMFVCVC